MSFAKNMTKNIGKNKRKNLIEKLQTIKYNQKLLDHAKQSASHLNIFQKEQFKKQQHQLKI